MYKIETCRAETNRSRFDNRAPVQIPREALMSCGDGANDLQLVANSGIGIAMGNAVPVVSTPITFIAKKRPVKGSHCPILDAPPGILDAPPGITPETHRLLPVG
jgi:3-deoxy-D-manno-octulosonate 8-phosphate phosphatase KdsC-like HAD superfamily phosphatase